MIFDALGAYWLKRSQSNMKSDFRGLDIAIAQTGQDFGGKVQSGGGSCHRPALARIYRLISITVLRRIGSRDVRRKRNMPDTFDEPEEILGWRKANPALPKTPASHHLGPEFVGRPEEKMLPHANLPSGTHQAFPLVGIVADLAGQKNLNAPTEKIAGCRIVRAEGLGLKTSAPSIESRREYPRVIENNQIPRPQQPRKITKLAIFQGSSLLVKVQKPRPGAVGKRLLSDQFFRKFVGEIGDQHARRL